MTVSVDRDARDRERAEARLAEKGMWLEKDWNEAKNPPPDVVTIYLVCRRGEHGIPETVATGTTWREACSNALEEPVF